MTAYDRSGASSHRGAHCITFAGLGRSSDQAAPAAASGLGEAPAAARRATAAAERQINTRLRQEPSGASEPVFLGVHDRTRPGGKGSAARSQLAGDAGRRQRDWQPHRGAPARGPGMGILGGNRRSRGQGAGGIPMRFGVVLGLCVQGLPGRRLGDGRSEHGKPLDG
jgi:hypothetical protein